MYNKVIIAGHLSRDIELRYTNGGNAIAKTSIAASRKYKAADGQHKEEVLFIDVAFYGRTAEVANQYLRKGAKVLIDGRLRLDRWTDKQGNRQSKHKVDAENFQMLDSKASDNRSQSKPQHAHRQPKTPLYHTEEIP